MARRYRMTPRRKAALEKARAASARKRRRSTRNRILGAAGVLGGLATASVAGHLVVSRVRQSRSTGPAPAGPGKQLDLLRSRYGVPFARTVIPRTKPTRKTDNLIKAFDGAAKRAAQGVKRKKRRAIYDQKSRREYWQQRPIAGRKVGRTISNPRTGRRQIHKRAKGR